MFCKAFSEPQPQLPGTELEQFPQCPLYAHSAFSMSFIFAVAVSLHLHFAAPKSAQQNAGDSTPNPLLWRLLPPAHVLLGTEQWLPVPQNSGSAARQSSFPAAL